MHDYTFSTLRDFMLKQSRWILQDDSGIPYQFLIENNFNIQIFGTYTQTIKVFAKHFQPHLQQACPQTPLPFQIGYNTWHNETVLMLAQKSNSTTQKATKTNQLIFKVQFKISSNKIPENSPIFKNLPKVDYYFDRGKYKYTLGSEKNEKDCALLKKLAIQNGFTDAFIIAIYNDKRISIKKARNILSF